jgi:phosphatidylinositol phospholipase C, delta
MQIHEALFQGNYQHGYILKPPHLLASSHPPSSQRTTPYESKSFRVKLDVQVISGQQLPRPKDYKPGQAVDPYVQIELICPNGQGTENRTRAVRDNEFNPKWDERLSFDVVTSSREFVFVRYRDPFDRPNGRFCLHNGDKSAASKLFASYCIRLQDLHQGFSLGLAVLMIGYRHVPLADLQGEKYIYSTLCVKINWSIQDHVTERLTIGKLEKRAKTKARLAKMEEASRSGTSLDSSGSSVLSFPMDDAVRMERGESLNAMELSRIHEVSETKET